MDRQTWRTASSMSTPPTPCRPWRSRPKKTASPWSCATAPTPIGFVLEPPAGRLHRRCRAPRPAGRGPGGGVALVRAALLDDEFAAADGDPAPCARRHDPVGHGRRVHPWAARAAGPLPRVDRGVRRGRRRRGRAARGRQRTAGRPHRPSSSPRSPTVRYVVEPRAGLDFARNRALAEATGESSRSPTTTSWSTPAGSPASAALWRPTPTPAACTGLVLPLELATEAQVRFERRGGFRRGVRAAAPPGAVGPGQPAVPVRRRHLRRRAATWPSAGARPRGAGRLRRGARHRPAAAGRRRPRHVLPGACAPAGRSSTNRGPWSATSTAATTPDCAASTGAGAPASWRSCPRLARQPEDRRTIARLVAWWLKDEARWAVHGGAGTTG